MSHPWSMSDGALWCPSCGDRVCLDDSDHVPDECRQCGFPDPESVADYHCGPDDDDGLCECCGETWDKCRNNFDCGMLPDGTCTLAGTEDCDWECPHS